MSNVWFTSDFHLSHRNIIRFCNRPFSSVEEMNEKIIENYNSVVNDNDTVYMLGDLVFGSQQHAKELLSRFKGKKYWILGNHDDKKTQAYHLFESVDFYKFLPKLKIVLCHYPFRSWRNMTHGVIALHGHSHGNLKPIYNKEGKEIITKQLDVGIDCHNYFPIDLDTVYNLTEEKITDTQSIDHH